MLVILLSVELQKAIDNLYKVFSAYSIDENIPFCGCPVCMTQEEKEKLITKPPKQLSSKELQAYNEDVGILGAKTPQDLRYFKYFLPRLVELIFHFDWPAHSPEISLQKLSEAHYKKWPINESKALEESFKTWWIFLLGTHPEELMKFTEIDECLCLVATAGMDIQELLKIWEADQRVTATCQLADFIVKSIKYKNPFWENVAGGKEEVLKWIKTQKIKDKLKIALTNFKNDPCTAEIVSAYNLLQSTKT